MTGSQIVASRGPVVGMDKGPWCRWTDVSGGARIMGRVWFFADVVWVRNTTTWWTTLDPEGGEESRSETYGDTLGFTTSIDDIVDKARLQAAAVGATPHTSVVVEALCDVEDRPLLLDHHFDGAISTLRSYRTIPDDWLRPDDPWLALRERPDEIKASTSTLVPAYVRPRRSPSLTLWSSRHPDRSGSAEGLFQEAWKTITKNLPPDVSETVNEGRRTWLAHGMTSP